MEVGTLQSARSPTRMSQEASAPNGAADQSTPEFIMVLVAYDVTLVNRKQGLLLKYVGEGHV